MDGGTTITCNFSEAFLLGKLEEVLADASVGQITALFDKIAAIRDRKAMQCYTLAPTRGAALDAGHKPQTEVRRMVKRVSNILAH